jgi:hypothetical protein
VRPLNKNTLLEQKQFIELKKLMESENDFYIDEDSMMTYAVKHYDNNTIKEVVDAGFKIDTPDKNYMTAIMHAAIDDNYEVIEYLVSKKGSARMRNLDNQSALDLAVMNNSFATSRYLLELYDKFTEDESLALEILSDHGKKYKNAMHLINTSNYEWVKVYKGNVILKKEYYFFVYWNESIPYEELKAAIGEEAKIFYIVDTNIKDYYQKHHQFEWVAECSHYHLDTLGKLDQVTIEFDELKAEEVDYIFDQFPGIYDYGREYVKVQTKVGVTSALRENGKLVAWAFCHDDGSLGGLYVIEERRNSGYAKQISANLINKVFNRHGGVYVDIVKGNIKSENLSKGLGFEYVRDNHWFEVK